MNVKNSINLNSHCALRFYCLLVIFCQNQSLKLASAPLKPHNHHPHRSHSACKLRTHGGRRAQNHLRARTDTSVETSGLDAAGDPQLSASASLGVSSCLTGRRWACADRHLHTEDNVVSPFYRDELSVSLCHFVLTVSRTRQPGRRSEAEGISPPERFLFERICLLGAKRHALTNSTLV